MTDARQTKLELSFQSFRYIPENRYEGIVLTVADPETPLHTVLGCIPRTLLENIPGYRKAAEDFAEAVFELMKEDLVKKLQEYSDVEAEETKDHRGKLSR